jgi:hypothetical protein
MDNIITPKPIRRKTPIFSLNDIVYEQQPNSAFNFNYSMLNLPKKNFTRRPRYRIKKKTWKTPISPIPEANDEDSKGGKKKKRRKRYTRKRKN